MKIANSSPQKFAKYPFYWWPVSQQLQITLLISISSLWLRLSGLGRVRVRFLEKNGQSQHCILSMALPVAEGRQLEVLPALAFPAGRRRLGCASLGCASRESWNPNPGSGTAQGRGRARGSREPLCCFFKKNPFLLNFAFVLPSN